VFIDEVGFSFLDKVGRTWAPVGQTPRLSRVSQRRALSTFVGLTLAGKLYKRHFTHAIRGPDVVQGLQHLQRQIPGPLVILWAGLSAHRSQAVQQYLAAHPEIAVEWFPSYAPELNPEELCHGNIKQHLRNAAPQSIAEMRRQVDRGFARLRQRPDLLLGFFHRAGLRVKRLS
jgi:transposase